MRTLFLHDLAERYAELGRNALDTGVKHRCWEALVRHGYSKVWAYSEIYG